MVDGRGHYAGSVLSRKLQAFFVFSAFTNGSSFSSKASVNNFRKTKFLETIAEKLAALHPQGHNSSHLIDLAYVDPLAIRSIVVGARTISTINVTDIPKFAAGYLVIHFRFYYTRLFLYRYVKYCYSVLKLILQIFNSELI